ncbi:NUDIX domain-containing protein [Patescibacteria group bacterium]|nr:NUDIX domain-containing protein [Patescibacteria group bacterium]
MSKSFAADLKKEILKFKNKKVDQKIIDEFLKKVSSTDKLTKEVNIDEHFCAFFVPVDRKTKSIYLGHHIKADDWIPPGGHIKMNEHPTKTVTREFKEELSYEIDESKIEIFNLSIKDVSNNPRSPCQLHFDFWYLVHVPKVEFKYLKKEFYDARWYTLDEALTKIKTVKYNQIVRLLKDAL